MDPVDPASGLIVLSSSDISFGGSRGQVGITRTFRGMSSIPGPFGVGTSHNYNYFVDNSYESTIPGASGSIALDMPDGNQYFFVGANGGTYTNNTIPSLLGVVITDLGGGSYNLRWKSGTVFNFCQCQGSNNPLAALISITDANGNQTTLGRVIGNQAQLFRVVDPVGGSLTLNYDTSGRITSISDPIGRTVSYTYNSPGTLSAVTAL